MPTRLVFSNFDDSKFTFDDVRCFGAFSTQAKEMTNNTSGNHYEFDLSIAYPYEVEKSDIPPRDASLPGKLKLAQRHPRNEVQIQKTIRADSLESSLEEALEEVFDTELKGILASKHWWSCKVKRIAIIG